MLRIALIILFAHLGGCYFLRSAATPMPYTVHKAPKEARRLVIFMPGLGDGPEHFARYDFVKMVQAKLPDADVIAPDAHLAYYRSQTLIPRLEEDVIGPARDKGYTEIWLVGISMGGFGSFVYTMAHPERITGIIALAPFMGDEAIVNEVAAAGGLRTWASGDLEKIEDATEKKFRSMWAWFQGFEGAATERPRLFLGYGADDRLRKPNGMVAELLPKAQVKVVPGGHKWVVWGPLFAHFLEVAFSD